MSVVSLSEFSVRVLFGAIGLACVWMSGGITGMNGLIEDSFLDDWGDLAAIILSVSGVVFVIIATCVGR